MVPTYLLYTYLRHESLLNGLRYLNIMLQSSDFCQNSISCDKKITGLASSLFFCNEESRIKFSLLVLQHFGIITYRGIIMRYCISACASVSVFFLTYNL